jgi:hypothetical protein
MVKRRNLLIGLCLLFAGIGWPVAGPATADDGVSVQALVDRTQVQPGESLTLKVVVGGGDGDSVVDLAPLTDFEIVSQGTATQISMRNMKTTREVTHNYQLLPRKSGALTIPALTVDVDGVRLRTQPIPITVSAQAAAPGSDRDIFVAADISNDAPYVGQQIRYTFTLYQGVQITDGRLEQPDFKGFEAHEFDERPTRRKVIGGREYLITEVSYLLIPLTPGALTIDPARLRFGLVKRQRRSRGGGIDDFFGDDFFGFGRTQVEPRLLTSKALKVAVRPLPAYTGAAPFSGLVGQFELSSTVAQPALKVGGSTTLAVTVKGRGNIRDAQAPPLEVPPAFKTYADAPAADIQMDGAGFSGSKVFRTALVPVTPGTYQLPASVLVYFDPAQGAYREARSAAIDLTVAPGEAGADTQVAVMAPSEQGAGVAKQAVAFTGKDLLPLKEGLDALRPPRRLGQPLFWILLLLPALAFAALSGALRLLRPASDARSQMRRKARRALHDATAVADGATFLSALRRALVAAVMGASGGSGEALTAEEARDRLEQCGIEAQTAMAAARLLEEIDGFHYSGSPLGADARADLLQRTGRLVRRMLK